VTWSESRDGFSVIRIRPGGVERVILSAAQPLQEYQIRLPNTSEGLSQLSRLYETAELLSVSYGEELVVKLREKVKLWPGSK